MVPLQTASTVSSSTRSRRLGWVTACLLFACASGAFADQHEAGFRPIFDGKTLAGWDGVEKFWRVEEGALTGETTPANPLAANTFILWRNGDVDDFELKLKYRINGGNSGIQYRSKEVDDHVIMGYQADIDSGDTWSGALYEEKGRRLLAERGEKTVVFDDNKDRQVETLAPSEKLQSYIKKDDWNDYHIIAQGNRFIHRINGHVMSEVTDKGVKDSLRSGLLALQLHAGPPMKVQFKDILLKRLPLKDLKKVVVVAGPDSHAKGEHEHAGGSQLLVNALNQNHPGILPALYTGGWPKDATAFDNADAIVVYSDGGPHHPLLPHLDSVGKLMERGVGLVCLHYAVEIPPENGGKEFVDWLGGYFKINWSVNPHWVADFQKLPDHPITRGVRPFKLNDEWYYHMWFRENMQGVTPILTAVPPPETLRRPDGPHSGNPHVRKKVGQPQHVAWATERPGGGRGFGLTGGHFHTGWANDNLRTLVLNAIAWAAHAEVPAEGVASKSPTKGDLRVLIGQPREGE